MSLDPIRIKELFRAAVALPPADRDGFLRTACGDHPALRRRVEELLASHVRADRFLEDPICLPSDPPGPYRPGDRLGRYALREVIGEGGMGTVWVAEQTDPFARQVAVKVVRPGLESGPVLARFEAERQALALMDHPNIAKVLDAGATPAGHPFFAMELVPGTPITAYCDDHRLTVPDRLGLFVDVCRAVQHAHQKGVIHRDLKPSNVLVAEIDGRPVPKVIDFGIAKAVQRGLAGRPQTTTIGVVIGTPEYMSPEQADPGAAEIDTRADVYALGALLYELLTGTTPLARAALTGLAMTEVLRRVREETPPPPSTRLAPGRLARELRRELDWVVMRALEKDRDRRYPSASELAADVTRYLTGEPVTARPPGRWYRVGKFVRRNRGPVAAAAVVALALVGGLAGTTIGMLKAREAEQAAVEARKNEEALRLAATEERDRASARESEARESEATTRLVLQYVGEKVFAAARPKDVEGGLGTDVTVLQAVDAAEADLAAAFEGRPLAEAVFRSMLGRTYLMAGQPRKAVRQYEVAARLHEARPAPVDALRARSDLAVALGFANRKEEAAAVLERVAPELTARLGPDHPDAVRAVLRLASAYGDLGRPEEAVRVLEDVVARLKDRLGPDDPETVMAEYRLAGAYRRARRADAAVPLLERNLDWVRAEHGAGHPFAHGRAVSLAEAYLDADRPAEAVDLLEAAVPGLAAAFRPDHPAVLHATAVLGTAYVTVGRPTEAVVVLERVVPAMEKNPGPDDRSTLEAAGRLARAYGESGRPADALRVLEPLVLRVRAVFGAEHPATAAALSDLAATLVRLDRVPEAKAVIRDRARLVRVNSRLRPAERGGELVGAGLNLLSLGDPRAAEPILRDALALLEVGRADGWELGQARAILGAVLMAQRRYAEAERLLLGGYAEMARHERPTPPGKESPLARADRVIVQLYQRWGKPDKARAWMERPEPAPPPRVAGS